MTKKFEITQTHDGIELLHLALDDGSGAARPGVVILPSFANRGAVEEDHAEKLVDLGYSVLVADIFEDLHQRSHQRPYQQYPPESGNISPEDQQDNHHGGVDA